jgi:hypothetical protein
MENLEMVSRITLNTKIIGKIRAIDQYNIEKLNRIKEERGWGKLRRRPQQVSGGTGLDANIDVEKLAGMIAEIIKNQNK